MHMATTFGQLIARVYEPPAPSRLFVVVFVFVLVLVVFWETTPNPAEGSGSSSSKFLSTLAALCPNINEFDAATVESMKDYICCSSWKGSDYLTACGNAIGGYSNTTVTCSGSLGNRGSFSCCSKVYPDALRSTSVFVVRIWRKTVLPHLASCGHCERMRVAWWLPL